MLDRAFRQCGEPGRGLRDFLCGFLGNGHADLAGVVKYGRIPIDDLKRVDRGVACDAADRLLADSGNIGLRIICSAIRTAWSSVGITKKMAFDPSVVRRSRGK